MHIRHLKIEHFRNLQSVDIQPEKGLNYFFGENGAGKTSILEALFLLARGKSFRTPSSDELIQNESAAFQIYLEAETLGENHRIGLERSKKNWRARKNGEDVSLLSELSRSLPIVLMEPNSHTLVSGSPDGRRRFLDWGVFHVEPGFLDAWRQYSRALKQRNSALRQRQPGVVDSIDSLLAPLGEQLNRYRQAYFKKLQGTFKQQLNSDRAGLQNIELRFSPGWKTDSLVESLQLGRKRDLELGVSQAGPHRADLLLQREGRAIKTSLSRGEQKHVAACLLLAQAELLKKSKHEPVILLDDLASEFDSRHFKEVLDKALACADQVWVTGVQENKLERQLCVFHVKHGRVSKVV